MHVRVVERAWGSRGTALLPWATGLLFLQGQVRSDITTNAWRPRTLLYFLISRTRLVKASSTLMRCLAEVSMNLQPKCLARSRPSASA